MLHVRRVISRATSNYILHNYLGRVSKCPCVGTKRFPYLHDQNGALMLRHGVDVFSHNFSTVLVQARDIGRLHEELETATNEGRLNDAWDLHEKHMRMEGFARKSILCKLIAGLTESLDIEWLQKAYGLVDKAFEEHKQTLFDREILIYLSLGLAKCGLPIPSSTLLRRLIEMENFPPVAAWSAIIAYMASSPSGAFLAAELVLEIGYKFHDGRVDPRKKCNEPLISMKPNATALNIALVGCLRYGITRKGEQLLDMIPRINMKTDATSSIIMAHIYERNGRRDELKKLRRHVEEVDNITGVQLRQFYNCLLSCHLKFGDLDSASRMVLEMLRKAKKAQNSLGVATLRLETDKLGTASPHQIHENPATPQRCFSCYEDFCRDKKFLSLEAEARELLNTSVVNLQGQVELVTTKRGILRPTEMTYVKLVKAFLEAGNTKDLVEFLIQAEKEDSPMSADNSVLVHVINSCISLGWLDKAHDLLDEMRLAGIRCTSSVYNFLLKAYHKENQIAEMKSLIRDARRAGVQLDASSYQSLIQSRVVEKDTAGALDLFKEMKEAKIPRVVEQDFDLLSKRCAEGDDAHIMSKLLQEIQEGQTADSGVHDWNSVIHFFCKKRLMQDAEKALKKMRSLELPPNAQTFHSMVTGYAAIGGKYIEVAELWGEMKSFAFSSGMKFDVELLDAVLYTFVRGGFFIRANEVVEMMEEGGMFVDKYKYRTLFLKYHKTLHKGKAPKFQTESQLKKREAALAFKKWIGL
ncbi:pentatricopeptide repeat-containing protein At1g03100, mitochondrial [Salvia hispanica]|uniref:pentatricopeptide repeat-containing protein At1g03100, mitochondrial n=1 Tax=Salvia hispanica TaxID=49212 RepID=UPI0020099B11|nr:pentatricopeptide repeat-containing protein At1g03100, mitochondrial [Salvia hispanica]XP_047964693.1 pentatricopeptide repeat-containing protein At1g03100, mitochondrial [Salvia hispanica]